MNKFKIKLDVFKSEVLVIQDDVLRYEIQPDDSHHLIGASAICVDNGNGTATIYFGKSPSAGIIAHECIHAAAAVLSGRGISALPDGDQGEVLCYLVQYLVEECNKRLIF